MRMRRRATASPPRGAEIPPEPGMGVPWGRAGFPSPSWGTLAITAGQVPLPFSRARGPGWCPRASPRSQHTAPLPPQRGSVQWRGEHWSSLSVCAPRWAGPGADSRLLSHGSDGDTDSVSTMVVHDVEEIAGTQTPYGGGTMVVQRVSVPPPSSELLLCPVLHAGTGCLSSVP